MTWERYKNILGVDTKKIRDWKRMCVGIFNPLMLHPFRAAQKKKKNRSLYCGGGLFLNVGSFRPPAFSPSTHKHHTHPGLIGLYGEATTVNSLVINILLPVTATLCWASLWWIAPDRLLTSSGWFKHVMHVCLCMMRSWKNIITIIIHNKSLTSGLVPLC